MKNMLSENMMRFGTKNLGPEQKRRLTLESVMQTINEHGLHREVRRRLTEGAGMTSQLTAGAAPVMGKKGTAQNFLYLHDMAGANATKRIHGMISPGKYPMTFEGDKVKVTTKAATFYLAGPTANWIIDKDLVAANVNKVETGELTDEMLNDRYFFVVAPGGWHSWQNSKGDEFIARNYTQGQYVENYVGKTPDQPR